MLEARSVSVRFGGVAAVSELSLEAPTNTVLGLVGPNGSGKSTFLNAVSGIVPATGRVSLDGVDLPMGRPRRIRRMGVMRAFQSPQLIPDLDVLDNILLADPDHTAMHVAAVCVRRRWLMRHERRRWQRANEALDFVGLADQANAEPGSLSYGYRRLVELARVIAAEPRVVLLDEPAAGLNAAETNHLAGIISELRNRDVTVLLVEHKIDFVDRLCDRIVVLNQGTPVAAGPPTEVWRNQHVIDAYLGSA
jgi:branched-chain amino acid transport system ATP-binding protein